MSAAGLRDPWHDDLLQTVRALADQHQRQSGPAPAASTPCYNWPEVSSRLSGAAAVAVADAMIPVNRRHTGLRRALILRLRTAIVTLLRFLTARQSAYNLDVLHALHETGRAVRSLERRLAAKEKEIGQLRERLSHLEAHPPIDVNRKAS